MLEGIYSRKGSDAFVLFSTEGFGDEPMHSGREDVLPAGLMELFQFPEM